MLPYRLVLYIFLLILWPGLIAAQSKKSLRLHKKAVKNMSGWEAEQKIWDPTFKLKIDSIAILDDRMVVELYFNEALSWQPVRESNYHTTMVSLQGRLGKKFRKYRLKVMTGGHSLDDLIPNYYRKSIPIDLSRFVVTTGDRIPVVRRVGAFRPSRGLYNRNIALWHSHGRYYEAKLDRWEWERARLFSTVEDLYPMSYVLPYLAPMLERAGANVFLPRERDLQRHEVIVDNDLSSEDTEIQAIGLSPDTIPGKGFMKKDTLFARENPFLMGSHLRFRTSKNDTFFIEYLPSFPADGRYAVYVSYVQSPDNVTDAKYTVFHAGGRTDFLINQQIGGGTWIYLGTFKFRKGKHPASGSVRLWATRDEDGWITADAVRFGGGMGNVARGPSEREGPFEWKTSGLPRYMEAARYYLQYAGMPDTLVWLLNEGDNDYKDDYMSRGEWVDYLMGGPSGPLADRNVEGLRIPVDLSLAFHTDAGTLQGDSIIGTLGIYSADRDDGKFPNGTSRMASRDLTDMIQTQIVHDIRTILNPRWTRRAMWDKQYSEAFRPNVPAMLLELMSHQNLADMTYGHDPAFKFAVSRAIYKAMTRFIAYQNGKEAVISPLPVDHMAITPLGGRKFRLSWKPVDDPLEPTAGAEKYKVYTRVDDGGFDNGVEIHKKFMDFEIREDGRIYSFKVTALNEGGESFDSEILSVGLSGDTNASVLVVNAFDRIAGTAVIDREGFAGLAQWDDEGVPDRYNINYVGAQYDYNRSSPWLDDDSPGWGASYEDLKEMIIPGNTFDNPYVHGKAIMAAGYSFISMSDEAFSDPRTDTGPYKAVDVIFGEEKTTETHEGVKYTVFDEAMQAKLKEFTTKGGNLFMSGAYVGTDHILRGDSATAIFAGEVLHFRWITNHAVRKGVFYAVDEAKGMFDGRWSFNTDFHPEIYKVEAPDAIVPEGDEAITAFRYGETNASAGILYYGKYKCVVLGFPFETVMGDKERNALMKQVLEFFSK